MCIIDCIIRFFGVQIKLRLNDYSKSFRTNYLQKLQIYLKQPSGPASAQTKRRPQIFFGGQNNDEINTPPFGTTIYRCRRSADNCRRLLRLLRFNGLPANSAARLMYTRADARADADLHRADGRRSG